MCREDRGKNAWFSFRLSLGETTSWHLIDNNERAFARLYIYRGTMRAAVAGMTSPSAQGHDGPVPFDCSPSPPLEKQAWKRMGCAYAVPHMCVCRHGLCGTDPSIESCAIHPWPPPDSLHAVPYRSIACKRGCGRDRQSIKQYAYMYERWHGNAITWHMAYMWMALRRPRWWMVPKCASRSTTIVVRMRIVAAVASPVLLMLNKRVCISCTVANNVCSDAPLD